MQQLTIPFSFEPLDFQDFKRIILRNLDSIKFEKDSGEEFSSERFTIPGLFYIDRGITSYMKNYNYFFVLEKNSDLYKHNLTNRNLLYLFALIKQQKTCVKN